MPISNFHVHIYINDVEYTEYTIAYTREQKICTGIGTLTISFVPTLPHDIVTWDNITIDENGNTRVGSYYVTSINKNQPGGEWSIVAQDASKRLTDHFIDQVFYIDYPSSSIPWLEYFLNDAGVTYSIDTAGPGSYLSNNTQLGMTSNYDQIVTLLQMNGWYMYFDAYDTCHIGNLTKGGLSDTLHTDDILDISILEHDKMLRNRVLVLGAANPFGSGYVHAEIQQQTKWNYDALDVRTAVIANSNIPTNEDAMGLATTAFKEFAQITVEKHITAKEARGLYVGDTIRVHHNLFEGTGLVTTYGTSMSKEGLVSNIVLDERCPRLFGFFKPPEYVYVATYGDGVYTKALETDPTWYNVSYGLTDTRVTDLHINKGIFVCATASGGALYANNTPIISPGGIGGSGTVLESLLWKPVNLEGLHPISGGVTDMSYTYSELKARAVILDRNYSHLHIAADERGVENFGDYLYSTSYSNLPTILSGVVMGSQPNTSGLTSDFQSCIIEASPTFGVSKVYPIRLSAEQAANLPGINVDDYIMLSGLRKGIGIYDIENDSITDYVSVGVNVSGFLSIGDGYQENQFTFGQAEYSNTLHHGTMGKIAVHDTHMPTSYSKTKTFYDYWDYDYSYTTFKNTPECIGLWSYMESSNVAYAAGIHLNPGLKYKVSKFTYNFESDPLNPPLEVSSYEHLVGTDTLYDRPVQIRMDAWGVFSFLGGWREKDSFSLKIKKADYNPVSDIVTTSYIDCTPDVATVLDIDEDNTFGWTWGDSNLKTFGVGGNINSIGFGTITIGDYVYCGFLTPDLNNAEYLDLWVMKTNLVTGENTFRMVWQVHSLEMVTNELYFNTFGYPTITMAQRGEDIQVIMHTIHVYGITDPYQWAALPAYGELIRVTLDGFDSDATEEVFASIGYVDNAGDMCYNCNFGIATGALNQNKAMLESRYVLTRGGEGEILTARYFIDTLDTITESDDDYISHYTKIYKMNGAQENETYGVAKYVEYWDEFGQPQGIKQIYIDVETCDYIKDVTVDGYVSVNDCYGVADALDGSFYFLGIKSIYDPDFEMWMDTAFTVSIDNSGSVIREFQSVDGDDSSEYPNRIILGNFILSEYSYGATNYTYAYWLRNAVPTNGTIYLLLQRNGEDYNILKSGLFPERLDISKYSPLVTFQRTIETVNVFNITPSGITVIGDLGMSGTDIVSVSGLLFGSGILVQDFRYADLIFGTNGILPVPVGYDPGIMLQEILVAYSGGLGIISVSDLSNISGIAQAEVGSIARVEATNSYIPDQYIFVAKSGFPNTQAKSNGTTVSGEWGFSQRSPTFPFADYSSGYPAARTTIIRIDDAL